MTLQERYSHTREYNLHPANYVLVFDPIEFNIIAVGVLGGVKGRGDQWQVNYKNGRNAFVSRNMLIPIYKDEYDNSLHQIPYDPAISLKESEIPDEN